MFSSRSMPMEISPQAMMNLSISQPMKVGHSNVDANLEPYKVDVKKPFFGGDLRAITLDNTAYRRILYTTRAMQLAVSSLENNDFSQFETHDETDHVINIYHGSGSIIIGAESYMYKEGDSFVIPAGTMHGLVSEFATKFMSTYSPPLYPKDHISVTKDDDVLAHL